MMDEKKDKRERDRWGRYGVWELRKE